MCKPGVLLVCGRLRVCTTACLGNAFQGTGAGVGPASTSVLAERTQMLLRVTPSFAVCGAFLGAQSFSQMLSDH